MKLTLFNLVYLNPGLATYKKTNPPSPVTQGQEVEFHEIEIGDRIFFDHEIELFFDHEIELFWHFS